jgi:hypothetical protein
MPSLAYSTLSVWRLLHNTHSLACHWQTYLPGRFTYQKPLQMILLCTQMQYQRGTGRNLVEKTAETQTSIRLSSYLVRAPTVTSNLEDIRSNSMHEHEPGILKTYVVQSAVIWILTSVQRIIWHVWLWPEGAFLFFVLSTIQPAQNSLHAIHAAQKKSYLSVC